MGYVYYGDARWKLCTGTDLSPTESKAITELYGAVRQYLPYILTVCTNSEEITDNDHVIYIGTVKSNPELLRLAEKGAFSPEFRKEGYSMKVMLSASRPGKTDIVIQGADPVGVLYAVYDFEHAYLDDYLKYFGYHFKKQVHPFVDSCPAFERKEAPGISNRGLWTWGHKIYDYKGYIDHMARCRMNMLVIWNDNPPLNGKDVVDYAHLNGVRVIWGYSCAWGEYIQVDPTDPQEAIRWGKYVLDVYEKDYAPLGGDGLYFQAFTEQNEKYINGVSIATLITDWINLVVQCLKNSHPELYVQFGIHATSIGKNYPDMKHLTTDVTPVWEDCGAFPFNYDPRKGNIPRTLEYSYQLIELAKSKGRFGAVLKGFTVLNWEKFEHYQGRILIGVTDKVYQKIRLEETQFYWKFCEPYWVEHAKDLQLFCQAVKAGAFEDSTIVALVEDGMFEEEIAPSVGLYAEFLWNPDANTNYVIEKIYHSLHFGH